MVLRARRLAHQLAHGISEWLIQEHGYVTPDDFICSVEIVNELVFLTFYRAEMEREVAPMILLRWADEIHS